MWKSIRPLLFTLEPETAHHAAFVMLELIQSRQRLCKLIADRCNRPAASLRTELFGLEFANPVGLAAGFDKDARLLPMWQALGFGFAEIGTITPLPQAGNAQPRLHRLPADEAIINRMGFNNEGAPAIRERLVSLLRTGRWPQFPVGVNLGKGRDTPLEKATNDYLDGLEMFFELGDYFVVNISSPNTPGLRELQEKPRLDDLLAAVQSRNRGRNKLQPRPLLVKVAPDLEWPQLDDILELCGKHALAGLIATNTTLSRDGLRSSTPEPGGLSGKPLRARATEFIRHIRRQTGGKLPVIGVGGVFTAADAYEKIRAGASLVQVYTGFVYEGPLLARKINDGLVGLLQRDGFRNLSEAVGSANP